MTMYALSYKQYSLMAVASISRIMHPDTNNAEMVQGWFEEPRSRANRGCAGQSLIPGALTWQLSTTTQLESTKFTSD